MPLNPALLRSKCRMLVAEYAEVFEALEQEIAVSLTLERVNEDDAFGYAKKTIRKEGMKEGISEFIKRINKYASER